MSKYSTYNNSPGDIKLFTKDDYTIYKSSPNIGRLYLVKDNKVVAQNMTGNTNINFEKWINTFEKNAEAQLAALTNRVDALINEKNEILSILRGIPL